MALRLLGSIALLFCQIKGEVGIDDQSIVVLKPIFSTDQPSVLQGLVEIATFQADRFIETVPE